VTEADVVSRLLELGIQIPKGLRRGQAKVACPRCSDTRKKKGDPCLSVSIEKGAWFCHHCGWKDRLVKGNNPYVYDSPIEFTRNYTLPDYDPDKFQLDGDAIEYWRTRGISENTLLRYGVGVGQTYMPQTREQEIVYTIPNYKGGMVVNVKYRGVEEKIFRQEKDAERTFYGLDDLFDENGSLLYDEIVICEGEVDKWSFTEGGILNVVSVPDGAPDPKSAQTDKKFEYLNHPDIVELLSRVKRVTLAVDGDEAGQRLATELSRRIGIERCYRIEWPDGCKDANDVLVKQGGDTLVRLFAGRKPYPVEGIICLAELRDEVESAYENGDPRSGRSTGWEGFDKICSYDSHGQLWTLTGSPNAGKSYWLDALIAGTILSSDDPDYHVAWFTPESYPLWKHVKRLARVYTGKPFDVGRTDRMTREEFDDALRWIDRHHTWIKPQKPTCRNILEAARTMVLRKGIRTLVIDPYNKMQKDLGTLSMTQYISNELDELQDFARLNSCDLFLVAHPRKLEKYKEPDPRAGEWHVASAYDISDSAHFYNKSDNVLSVYRRFLTPDLPVEVHIQKGKDNELVQAGTVGYFKFDRKSGGYTHLRNSTDTEGESEFKALKAINNKTNRRQI
jgi:twinkle protein